MFYKVLSEKTTMTLWLKLESLYMTKSSTNKLYLKNCLYMSHMSEGVYIKSHLDDFNT